MKVRNSEASPRAVLSGSPRETEEDEELEDKKKPMVGSPKESYQGGFYYSRRWGFVSNATRVNPEDETDAGSSPKKYNNRDSISQSPFKERSFVVRPFDNDESGVFNRMDSSKQQMMMLNHESSTTMIKLFSTPKKREDQGTDEADQEEEEDLAKYSAKK